MLTESQRRRVEDLHSRYIRLIDDGRMEEWPELFTDYCHYRVTARGDTTVAWMECRGKGMLADRAAGLRGLSGSARYSHQISGLWVESFDGETAVCRSNFLVVRTEADGTMGILSAGVYADKIALDGESTLFEERLVIADSLPDDTLLVVPL